MVQQERYQISPAPLTALSSVDAATFEKATQGQLTCPNGCDTLLTGEAITVSAPATDTHEARVIYTGMVVVCFQCGAIEL